MHELNLLPPSRRQRLQVQHYVLAVQRLLAIMFVGVCAIGVVGLGAGAWLAWARDNGQSVALQTEVEGYVALQDRIVTHNAQLKFLAAESKRRVVWSALLHQLVGIIPDGITLSQLRVDGDKKLLVISGVARTRADLVVLERQLHQLTWVEEVRAPQANFLQRANSAFTIDLVLIDPLPV